MRFAKHFVFCSTAQSRYSFYGLTPFGSKLPTASILETASLVVIRYQDIRELMQLSRLQKDPVGMPERETVKDSGGA